MKAPPITLENSVAAFQMRLRERLTARLFDLIFSILCGLITSIPIMVVHDQITVLLFTALTAFYAGITFYASYRIYHLYRQIEALEELIP